MSVIPSRVPGLIIDLFAGAGGASIGIEAATGRRISIAINHSPIALAVHRANHPETVHLVADVFEVDPFEACQGIPIDDLWASPDCTHFSVAKGGQPRKQNIRSLADVVLRWAALPKHLKPKRIYLENVREFEGWGPLGEDCKPIKERKGEEFGRWKSELEGHGYVVEHRVLIASHFGAPTSRKRLFLVARSDGKPIVWPKPTHGPGLLPFHTAAECIDWSLPCPSIFERSKPLRPKTLARIAEGIKRFVLENPHPHIVGDAAMALIQTSYGERKGQRPRVLDLHEPLGTVVAQGQKHALVAAFLAAHYGGEVGTALDRPIRTVTAQDHHSLVYAFLAAYYGADAAGQALTDPVRTVTTQDRFGLVTVHGVNYQIVDIGMRMLQPHELKRAQFGRFAEGYDLSAARTKTAQVRLIGNSVCPEVAEAVVACNSDCEARVAA